MLEKLQVKLATSNELSELWIIFSQREINHQILEVFYFTVFSLFQGILKILSHEFWGNQ